MIASRSLPWHDKRPSGAFERDRERECNVSVVAGLMKPSRNVYGEEFIQQTARSGLTDEGFGRNNHCYIYNILILTDWSDGARRREREREIADVFLIIAFQWLMLYSLRPRQSFIDSLRSCETDKDFRSLFLSDEAPAASERQIKRASVESQWC
jgi:hypothetical protein